MWSSVSLILGIMRLPVCGGGRVGQPNSVSSEQASQLHFCPTCPHMRKVIRTRTGATDSPAAPQVNLTSYSILKKIKKSSFNFILSISFHVFPDTVHVIRKYLIINTQCCVLLLLLLQALCPSFTNLCLLLVIDLPPLAFVRGEINWNRSCAYGAGSFWRDLCKLR